MAYISPSDSSVCGVGLYSWRLVQLPFIIGIVTTVRLWSWKESSNIFSESTSGQTSITCKVTRMISKKRTLINIFGLCNSYCIITFENWAAIQILYSNSIAPRFEIISFMVMCFCDWCRRPCSVLEWRQPLPNAQSSSCLTIRWNQTMSSSPGYGMGKHIPRIGWGGLGGSPPAAVPRGWRWKSDGDIQRQIQTICGCTEDPWVSMYHRVTSLQDALCSDTDRKAVLQLTVRLKWRIHRHSWWPR